MYVIIHKQNILILNNLLGDHVLLNTRWQFGVLLSLSAYVYDPTYIGPQYNKKTTWKESIWDTYVSKEPTYSTSNIMGITQGCNKIGYDLVNEPKNLLKY